MIRCHAKSIRRFFTALVFFSLTASPAQAKRVPNEINFSEIKPVKVTANGDLYSYRVNLKTAEPREQKVVKVNGVDTTFYKAVDAWFYSVNWNPSDIFKDYPTWKLDSKAVPPEDDYLLPSYEISTTDPKVAVSDLGYELSVRGKRFKPGEGAANGPNNGEITFEDWGANFTGLAIEKFTPSIQVEENAVKQTYLGNGSEVSITGTTTAGRKIERGQADVVYKYTHQVAVQLAGAQEWIVIRDFKKNAQGEIVPDEKAGLEDHKEIAKWNLSESKTDGTRKFPAGVYTVRLTVKPEAGQPEQSVTASARVLAVDISAANVSEADEETRGAVIAVNNDNDDFLVGTTYNYDQDKDQTGDVGGEDDLQKVTLKLDTILKTDAQLKEGDLTLEISQQAGQIKVWKTAMRTGTPVLDANHPSLTGKAKEFGNAGIPNAIQTEYYVEGLSRSETVRQAQLKLSYKYADPQQQGAENILSDKVNYTVIELTLDNYAQFLPTITSINDVTGAVAPSSSTLQLGPLNSEIANTANMKFADKLPFKGVTRLRGVAMNKGDKNAADFSFADDEEKISVNWTLQPNQGPSLSQPLYCFDWGGRCRIVAEVMRGNTVLCRPELIVPLDTDGDWLPDVWEIANATDAVRQAIPEEQNAVTILNPRRNDTLYDQETQPEVLVKIKEVVQRENRTADFASKPPIRRNDPVNGQYGDGLTAWEEYRGFYIGENATTAKRLRADQKDVFAFSDVKQLDRTTPAGTGFLTSVEPQLIFQAITKNQWNGNQLREINFNRFDEGGAVPGTLSQHAVYVTDKNIGWEPPHAGELAKTEDEYVDISPPFIGYTRGGITTGPNGVCNSRAAPTDFQIIPVGQGLKNSIAILPGPNGIIDPPYNPLDDLDAKNRRIVSKNTDGKNRLYTVTSSYQTLGEGANKDLVKGHIVLDPNVPLALDADTAINAAGDSVAADRKSIEEGAATGLQSRPRPNTNDYVSGYIDGGINGGDGLNPTLNTAATPIYFDSLDVLVRQNNIPIKIASATPDNDENGRVYTVAPQYRPQQDDVVVGKIITAAATLTKATINSIPKVGNQFLDVCKDANGQVLDECGPTTKTIEMGPDGKLDARPYGADYFFGYISGGPNVGDKIDAPPSDIWDSAKNVIRTGYDGICQTSIKPGSDDIQIIDLDKGQPHALGIDASSRAPMDAATDAKVNSGKQGDDQIMRGEDYNVDPNQTVAGYVDVAAVYGEKGAIQYVYAKTDENGMPVMQDGKQVWEVKDYNPKQNAADNTQKLAVLLTVIAHEGGHVMDVDHWVIRQQDSGSDQTFTNVEAVLMSKDGEEIDVEHDPNIKSIMITPLYIPSPSFYDPEDKVQFRLHRHGPTARQPN